MTKETKNIEILHVESIEKNLSSQIEKLQNLNKLIKNRAIFQEKKEHLKTSIEEIEKEIEAENFESQSFALSFLSGKYRNDESFRISNPILIKEIAQFIVLKIDAKIEEIEGTIIKTA